MAGTDDDHDAISRHILNGKAGFVDNAFDKADIGIAVENRRCALCRVAYFEPHIDLGMVVTEARQTRGEPVACDRLAGMDAHKASAQRTQIVECCLRLFNETKDCLGFLQKDCAFLGELDAPAHAIEELHDMPRFKRVDGAAHC